jgi:hypothetical protein
MSDKMLPIMTVCAKGLSPWTTARIPTCIKHHQLLGNWRGCGGLTPNSTALPKVALINAPSKSPNSSDSLSERSDTRADSGIIARKLKMDTTMELALNAPAARPSGTKTQNTLISSRSAVVLAAW